MTVAFDAICDPADWRAPIDVTLTIARADELGGPYTIREAILHFTGTYATFAFEINGEKENTKDPNNVVRVEAPGYRAGPAGP